MRCGVRACYDGENSLTKHSHCCAGIMFTYSPRQVISTLKVQLPVLNRHLVLTSRPTISIFTYTPNVCLQGMKAPDPCEEHGCMAFCIGACGIRCLLPTSPWPDSSLNWAFLMQPIDFVPHFLCLAWLQAPGSLVAVRRE